MAGMNNKGMISKLMGVIIILLDLYWTWVAYSNGGFSLYAIIGIVIFLASLIWLWADM